MNGFIRILTILNENRLIKLNLKNIRVKRPLIKLVVDKIPNRKI
mgnify:CR=1 FL=1